MIKYYINYYRNLIPCYLIKEGYLPCDEYDIFLKNGKNMYGNGYTVEDFCIYCDPIKDIFEDLKKAKEVIKDKIKGRFQEDIKDLIKHKEGSLKRLEAVE